MSVIIEEKISLKKKLRSISLEYHLTETPLFGLNLFMAVMTLSSLNLPEPKNSLIHIVSNRYNNTRRSQMAMRSNETTGIQYFLFMLVFISIL